MYNSALEKEQKLTLMRLRLCEVELHKNLGSIMGFNIMENNLIEQLMIKNIQKDIDILKLFISKEKRNDKDIYIELQNELVKYFPHKNPQDNQDYKEANLWFLLGASAKKSLDNTDVILK